MICANAIATSGVVPDGALRSWEWFGQTLSSDGGPLGMCGLCDAALWREGYE
ncbi:unannotated protein [freshwater metagenome]|uniref:Unannotated protein n=1 Tax=freshwater metagenome TaxID=449393 RepID=A0A6J7SEZ6_9ZZZZ